MDALVEKVRLQFEQRSHIAHGFDHVERVARLAGFIATQENFDPNIAMAAGYLHDIGRTVQEEEKDHGPAGVVPARRILDSLELFDVETRAQIIAAVRDHSALKTEGQLTHIVQDADMLDGLGYIGIMRAYTSKASLPCYEPANIFPEVGRRDTTIHEQIAFQMEWLDFMHTGTAKRIATARHQKMMDFLEGFQQEVLGLDYS